MVFRLNVFNVICCKKIRRAFKVWKLFFRLVSLLPLKKASINFVKGCQDITISHKSEHEFACMTNYYTAEIRVCQCAKSLKVHASYSNKPKVLGCMHFKTFGTLTHPKERTRSSFPIHYINLVKMIGGWNFLKLLAHWHTLGREREVVFPYITLTGVKMIDSWKNLQWISMEISVGGSWSRI